MPIISGVNPEGQNIPPTQGVEREATAKIGIGKKVRRLLGTLAENFNPSASLCFVTHLGAEHMGRGSLAGNSSSFALGQTLKLLEKMGNRDQKLINSLNYAKKIAKQTEEGGMKVSSIARQVKKDMQNLTVGENLIIPSNSKTHAMLLEVSCTGQKADGSKTFRVVQHNEGNGLSYHYSKLDEKGKRIYQTGLVIENVEGENLFGTNSTFFDDLIANSTGTIETLYENILPQLKGTLALPSKDPSLWSHGQVGGSCSAKCCLSWLRSHLGREGYRTFKESARSEMVLKSYAAIKRGWGNTTTRKMVTLEMIKGLEKGYFRRNEALPQSFQTIKRELESDLREIQKKSTNREKNSGSCLSALSSILQDKQWKGLPLEELQTELKKLPTEELEKLLPFASELIHSLFQQPLTREQIYEATALSSILLASFHSFEREEIKKMKESAIDLHTRFNALGLASSVDFKYRPFLSEIERDQRRFMSGLRITNEMRKMMIRMNIDPYRNFFEEEKTEKIASNPPTRKPIEDKEMLLSHPSIDQLLQDVKGIGYFCRESQSKPGFQVITTRYKGETKKWLFKEEGGAFTVNSKNGVRDYRSVDEMVRGLLELDDSSFKSLPLEALLIPSLENIASRMEAEKVLNHLLVNRKLKENSSYLVFLTRPSSMEGFQAVSYRTKIGILHSLFKQDSEGKFLYYKDNNLQNTPSIFNSLEELLKDLVKDITHEEPMTLPLQAIFP